VHVLDNKIRESIRNLPHHEGLFFENGSSSDGFRLLLEDTAGGRLPMTALDVPRVSFEEETDLPEALRDRIELPFVSNLAEEDDNEQAEKENDDQDSGVSPGMVVVTFPPPPTDDCVMVTFGPGLQAYLDYTYGPEEDVDDEDTGSTVAQADAESQSSLPKTQTDYV